jgi:hypothetical protein
MGKPRSKPNYRRRVLRLPDLDHCKSAVLNSLGWHLTASSSCAIACTWNRAIWPPTPSTNNWRLCEDSRTKPPMLAYSARN